jgi:ATP-dependent 26S proteasome regulatory subunit
MVHDMFRLARENSSAIIFIDEIDAIATNRFDTQTSGDREVQRILPELLNQMDGFDQGSNVKVGILPRFQSFSSAYSFRRSSFHYGCHRQDEP